MGIDAYRNLEHLVLDFDDVNVIYGENAQGKTNLIEAVYLFTGAKSFRGARDSELVQFGKEQAQLQIHFVSGNRPQTAMLQIKKTPQRHLKRHCQGLCRRTGRGDQGGGVQPRPFDHD